MIPDYEGGYKRQANGILSPAMHFRPPHRCWRVLPPKRPKTFSLRVSEFAFPVGESGQTRLDSFTGEGGTGRFPDYTSKWKRQFAQRASEYPVIRRVTRRHTLQITLVGRNVGEPPAKTGHCIDEALSARLQAGPNTKLAIPVNLMEER